MNVDIEFDTEKPVITVKVMSDFQRLDWEITESKIQCIIDQSELQPEQKIERIKEVLQ